MFQNVKSELLILAILISTFSSGCFKSPEINDLIQPVNLVAGKTDSVTVSDMFYSEDYSTLRFIPNSIIDASFNFDRSKVLFTPSKNAEGLALIDFNFDGSIYELPVKINNEQSILFRFKPNKKYKKIFLFGSFNSWNRSEFEMRNIEGIYETSIPLEPGRYQYKFFADGAELIDPENSEKIPNGMGDYNSVLTVEKKHNSKSFLHIGGMKNNNREFTYSFILENKPNELAGSDVIALLNNKKIQNDNIKIDGNKIDLVFSDSQLKGKNTLRTAVTQNGLSTNIQTLILFDGKPAGSDNKKFTWHDAIIYSALIDRFDDGDKSLNKPIQQDSLFDKANYMGGDFQGIIYKLKQGYFDSLGITTIWLSPVYDNTNNAFREFPKPHRWFSGYHGYWPVKPR